MITVTNIETFYDHFAQYENVDVIAVVGVVGTWEAMTSPPLILPTHGLNALVKNLIHP